MSRVGMCVCAFAVGVLLPTSSSPQPDVPADLVLFDGHVLTVDARDSVAEAVAIRAGKILAVGPDAVVRARIGRGTEAIDLHGRAVTPGLIDTHVHFSEAAELFDLNLADPAINTIDAVLQRVRDRVIAAKPGEWVHGYGWDEGKLAERRYIVASDLDKVAPRNPVWLQQTTHHYGVANSYALKLAKLTGKTPDPPGGRIDRDADGAPTGILKDAAQPLVVRLIPPYTRDQERQGLLKIIEDFNQEGMTGAKDPGIDEEKWELYRELLASGRLTVRMFVLWRGPQRPDDASGLIARLTAKPRPPASLGDGVLLSGGVKMFMDGSGGARTAWMYGDWNKNFTDTDAGNTGYPAIPPDAYREIVTRLHRAGIHVSTHAIGDRAIDWVVDTYDVALRASPIRGLRHGIVHANTPTDHAMDVMARLQREYDAGYPEAQPGFMWWIGDTYAANLGSARALRLEPLATWKRRHIIWTGGSDYSVTPFPARYGLWASARRKTLNGTYGPNPFGTVESVDVRTALRSYTIWAARQLFLEHRIGSIEVGKDADLAVWDRDPYTIAADQLKDLRCDVTVFGGKIVYRRAQPTQRAP